MTSYVVTIWVRTGWTGERQFNFVLEAESEQEALVDKARLTVESMARVQGLYPTFPDMEIAEASEVVD